MTDLLTPPASAPTSPFGEVRAGRWSRRSFLGASSALSLGAVAGCSMPWSATDDDLLGPADAGVHPKSGAGSSGASDYSLVTPLELTAVSELTQDYFVFQTHKIDPAKDTVIAYSRADGEVEAILLQDGAIKQVYRDSTQPGGWNVHTFAEASDVTDVVAGVSRAWSDPGDEKPSAPVLKVFYRTKTSNPDQLNIAVADGGKSPSFTTTTVAWNAKAGPLQLTVGFDESLLVTSMVQSTSITATDAKLYLYTDTHRAEGQGAPTPIYGSLSGFSYNTAAVTGPLPPRWSATLVHLFSGDTQVSLALPNGTYGPTKIFNSIVTPPSISQWGWPIKTARPNNVSMTDFLMVATNPAVPSSTTTAYSVEYLSALGSKSFATSIVRTLDNAGGTPVQRLWAASPASANGAPPTWTWTELLLPASQSPSNRVDVSTGISPLPPSEVIHNDADAAHRFMDVFVLADGQFSVVRQAPQGNADLDLSRPTYCPAIPLQNDVAAMTSQANVSTGNELLVVGDDGILQYLIKDPVSDLWTDNPVHLPADDLEEASVYQVSLALVDGWGAPVPNRELQITANTQTTALIDGAAAVLGADAVSVATDADGQVVVALLADGMSAATLTVTADGAPTATVNPSAAVNTFMQGGTSLNYLPPFTTGTLATAKAADGSLVAPGAGDASAADDVDTMQQAATEAAKSVGTLTLSRRRAQPRRRRDGQLSSRSKKQVASMTGSVDNWANDLLHGIKKGAVKVAKVAREAGEKAFTITTDVIHWIDKEIKVLVTTIVDAAHVIEAALVKLGTVIKKAIEWVRAEVFGTLQDAAALGGQYARWLEDCCSHLAGYAKTEAEQIDHWLATRQKDVHDKLLAVANGYAASTSLAMMATNPPRGAGANHPSSKPPRAAGDDGDDGKPLHGDWLFRKAKNAVLGELDLSGVTTDIQPLMAAALKDAGQALEELASAFRNYLKFLRTVITHPSEVMTVGVHDLLLATVNLVDAAFDLARGFCTAMMAIMAAAADAIPTMLRTELKSLPVLGKILQLVGLGNATFGHLVGMIFAFPAVVTYKITHQGQGRPLAGLGSKATRGQLGSGDPATDLKQCAGTAVMVWSTIDALGQFKSAFKLPNGMFFTAIDIAAPIIVGFLTVPSTANGQPYLSPPVTGKESDQLNFGAWLTSILPAGLSAAGYWLEHKLDDKGAKDPDLPGQQRMIALATCMTGVFALGMGCQANKDSDDPTGMEYALAVLLNLPYIVVPATDAELVEATEGISAGIASMITLATGNAGGLLYQIT